MVCPCETPEGRKIGIVKNFALMTKVTNGLNESLNEGLKELLRELGGYKEFSDCEDLNDLDDFITKTKVFLNGNWIGFTNRAQNLVQSLKMARTRQLIPAEVSIVRDILHKEIRIYTDSGRWMRPLLVVSNNKMKLNPSKINNSTTFQQLLREGVVEFIDV